MDDLVACKEMTENLCINVNIVPCDTLSLYHQCIIINHHCGVVAYWLVFRYADQQIGGSTHTPKNNSYIVVYLYRNMRQSIFQNVNVKLIFVEIDTTSTWR